MQPKKPKRGRPPKPKTERRRNILSVRVRDETLKALTSCAEKAERSISQEVESRLERSFEALGMLPEVLALAYGRQLAGLLMVMGRAMSSMGEYAGFMSKPTGVRRDDWPEDPFAYDLATKALAHVVEGFRPSGQVEAPKLAKSFVETAGMSMEELSRGFANGVLSAAAGRPAKVEDRTFAKEVRSLLGKLAEVETPNKEQLK